MTEATQADLELIGMIVARCQLGQEFIEELEHALAREGISISTGDEDSD